MNRTLKKISYDVILVTSLLRHQLTSQVHFGLPPSIKISGYVRDNFAFFFYFIAWFVLAGVQVLKAIKCTVTVPTDMRFVFICLLLYFSATKYSM